MVELARASGGGAQTQRDRGSTTLGEFRLEGMRRGTYVLTLRMGDDEIVLPPIEVGERRADACGGTPFRAIGSRSGSSA